MRCSDGFGWTVLDSIAESLQEPIAIVLAVVVLVLSVLALMLGDIRKGTRWFVSGFTAYSIIVLSWNALMLLNLKPFICK